MRQCTRCGEAKDESQFYVVRDRDVTRLRRVCKPCSAALARIHPDGPLPSGRTCSRCSQYKPLSEFHKHSGCLYGVEPMCKACRLEKRREYSRRYPERVRNTDLQ